ncbi:MAG: hypothetical protein LC772_11335, partial [Chloroflexi bacterium]|nr:hypothetical protein [Chloroflexota bacterium]
MNTRTRFRVLPSAAALAFAAAVTLCVWLFYGPEPAQPILWRALDGVGLTTPGSRFRTFNLRTRSGGLSNRDNAFTFWGDDLVYWSARDDAFGILPPAGPVRWVPFSECNRNSEVWGLCGNKKGIIVTVGEYTGDFSESRRLFRVQLPSGAVQEIPDAVAVQC